MSKFADDLMLKYMTPAKVADLLTPPNDPNRLRVRQLLQGVYETRFLNVRQVDTVEVLAKQYQVPLPQPADVRATWEKVLPVSERSFGSFTAPQLGREAWVGMELDTKVSIRAEITSGAVEEIASEDLSEVSTEEEFAAKFQFIDLEAFKRQAGVTSFQELKALFPRQFRLQFAQPPPFDPTDVRFARTFRLSICALFMPELNVEETLREAKLSRRAAEAGRPTIGEVDGAEVATPCAWMVIFPKSTLPAAGPPETAYRSLFAAEGMVAAFEDPT
jgi:hypothetical protein